MISNILPRNEVPSTMFVNEKFPGFLPEAVTVEGDGPYALLPATLSNEVLAEVIAPLPFSVATAPAVSIEAKSVDGAAGMSRKPDTIYGDGVVAKSTCEGVTSIR